MAPWITGGLAGAILTLIAKLWSERRRRRIINLDIHKQLFSLPEAGSQASMPSEELTVSYKHNVYKNLALYAVKLDNIGYRGVDGLELVFSFPRDTLVVDHFLTTSPTLISHTEEQRVSNQLPERIYRFNRIEPDDNVTISFLLTCQEIEKIHCLPRGTDEVEYFIGERGFKTEIEQAAYRSLVYFAIIISLGAVPIIANVLEGIAVLLAIPSVIRLMTLINAQKDRRTNQVEIETIHIENSTKPKIIIGQHSQNE